VHEKMNQNQTENKRTKTNWVSSRMGPPKAGSEAIFWKSIEVLI
jgi:hypothetical protein